MTLVAQAPRTFYARTQRAVLRLVAEWIGRIGAEPGTYEIKMVTLRRGQARFRQSVCWEAEVTWHGVEAQP